ncbi:Rsd/AlgQ family anti-sigma factor [Candidatus Endoriftia persephonae]|jgi:regulator of sigma D|uniref:Stationary-phase regulator of sigma D, the major sigma subunit ofRNA polymerase n=4 Tax=Gammaproteobacteria TaxID=1236 RepID=G2FCN0_9GAMM|nr:Rsd/AlgQ family anti-sigma factor [Candidatus Endoriftia persephone]EGW55593.1 stationary-phase regulator of sigma D, the major sigma subunit ofRNA polymerase [endosymbiont of Tevnia jerichonana (vent Tica)]KRT54609.1 Regulator of sigma D [endosymbiont of Ridgeia piscesae]KRT57552.1 regulator of sigma D [endosymbiont of Ridgeia piscesae]USF89248.1 sigma D regulator [Candidatus Endoriftia persephone]
MSTQQQATAERRTGTQGMINNLMEERRQMLVLFCQVAGLEPYARTESLEQLLQNFCQVLVDYTAFGHFEVFGKISDGTERRSQVLHVAEEIYPGFVEATETAVAFNDKYDISDHALSFDHLSEDMSLLGEEIAIRIELEDRLIATMLAR